MQKKSRSELLEKGQYLCDEAVNYARQGAHTTAMEYFDQAETCFEKINDFHWLTFLRHEKLQTIIALGKLEEAQSLTDEISTGYLETKNFRGLTLLLIHKANLLLELDDIDAALAQLRLAEGVAAKQSEQSSLGYVYSTMAGLYSEMQQYIQAIDVLAKVDGLYSEEENPAELAWCYHLNAFCHEQIFHIGDAEKLYEKSVALYLEEKQFDDGARVLDDLRKLYQSSGDEQKEKKVSEKLIQMSSLYPNIKY